MRPTAPFARTLGAPRGTRPMGAGGVAAGAGMWDLDVEAFVGGAHASGAAGGRRMVVTAR